MSDLRLVNCYNTTGDMSKSEREETILASAKSNLERMAFFGITSEQAKSQYLFEYTFDLKFKVSFDAHNQHSKNVIPDLDEETLAEIKKLNRLDIELFKFAQKLMEKRFNEVLGDDANFEQNYHAVDEFSDEEIYKD